MKKFYLFLLTLLVALTASAERVSEQQAFQKAQYFLKGKQLVVSPAKARGRDARVKDSLKVGYYVFNAANNDGFVIIASDDRMPEVLGYSEHGSLVPETAPCNVKWLLEYYNKVAASFDQPGTQARAVARAAKPAVRPLVTTKWDQGAPYNDQCPELNGSRCITGCVATAMAQVINYNRWPQGQTTGVPAYVTNSSQISVPALGPTKFNWDNMTNDDIARLMRYCGQSVQMDYGTFDSGAFPNMEPSALIDVFGYSQATHFVEHASYSDEEWENLLYNELAEQRPIVFNGYGGTGGHTFVVHGYKDGMFYINWGWSGNEDGYFMLTGMNTNAGDYNNDQSATIGIQPPAGNIVGKPGVVIKRLSTSQGKYTSRDENGEFKNIIVSGTLISDISKEKEINIGLALYTDEGLNKILHEETHLFKVGEPYDFETSFDIDKSVANGTYRLVAVCRDSENDNWMTDANSSDYYLEIVLDDERMRIRVFPLSSEERAITDEKVISFGGLSYRIYTEKSKHQAILMDDKNNKPKGEVYIPDDVECDGVKYHVYGAEWETFWDCPELITLSTAMTYFPGMSKCEKLTNVELRDGVTYMDDNDINWCNKLDSIVFPKTLVSMMMGIGGCDGLKYIRFANPNQFTMNYFGGYRAEWYPSLKDIYFASPTPPVIDTNDYDFSVNPNVTIHVPEGSKVLYETGDWRGWNIVEDQPAPKEKTIELGYCAGMEHDSGGWGQNAGGNDAELAIRMPAESLKPYIGKKITGIKYFQTADVDYAFITKPGVDYLVKQPVEGKDYAWITVQFDEPYTIKDEDLYIGIGCHQTIVMFMAMNEQPTEDGHWFRAMGTDTSSGMKPGTWVNLSQDEEYRPIPLKFYVKGEDFVCDLGVSNVSIEARDNGKYEVNATVYNRMADMVNSYTLSWDIDGKTAGSKKVETVLVPNGSEKVNFEIEAVLNGKNHQFNYAISEINGQADAVESNSKGSIAFLASSNTYFPRKIVMEEATGTWCGWCVYGIETIERLKKDYPDNFIAIGLHNGDEMDKIEGYDEITSKFNSYPSCLLNRTQSLSPAYPDVKPIIEEMKDNAMGKISVSASFTKSDNSGVKVVTETEFGFDEDDKADYRIAFVVLEDHVGPYVQTNYFSGDNPSPGTEWMEEWMKKDGKVKMEYYDVARGIYGGVNGVKGSIPTTIKEGQKYNYEYTFSLPKNIQNKENVSIVALLIDNKTGEIINADLCKMGEGTDPNPQPQTKVFEFRYEGQSLENGATVVINAEEDSWGFGEMNCETNPSNNPKNGLVLVALGNVKTGTAKLEILSNSLNPGMIQWCMGGECVPMNSKTSLEKTFTADSDGLCQVQFDATNIKTEGKLVAKLTATVGSETKTVNIQFVYSKSTPISQVEFRYEGKPVENNGTVTIHAEEDSWGFGEMNCETNPSSNPKNGLILVTPDGEQSGTAKLEILGNTLNPGMVQWCMGGDCVPMNNKTSLEKSFRTDKDGIVQVQFDANNIKTEGMLEAKLTATVGNETKTVNIKFVYEGTNGISIIYSDGDSDVWYDLNGTRLNAAPTRKGVYIKNGKKVVK